MAGDGHHLGCPRGDEIRQEQAKLVVSEIRAVGDSGRRAARWRREKIARRVFAGFAADPKSGRDCPALHASFAFAWADAFIAEADKEAK